MTHFYYKYINSSAVTSMHIFLYPNVAASIFWYPLYVICLVKAIEQQQQKLLDQELCRKLCFQDTGREREQDEQIKTYLLCIFCELF